MKKKNKNKRKKNKAIKYVLILLFIIICFFGFKGVMLFKYNVEKVKFENGNVFKNQLTITKNNSANSNAFNVENVTIRNDFKKYQKNEKNGDFYVLRDKNKKVVSFLGISSNKQYINVLTSNSFVVYSLDNNIEENKENAKNNFMSFTDKDRVKFLSKNNIKNDVDLLEYIQNNYYLKNSIFTSLSNMKENYIINNFVATAIPAFESITLINGDFDGYIYNINNNEMREVHILNSDKDYIFVLSGDKITTDEYIQSLIGSLSIN